MTVPVIVPNHAAVAGARARRLVTDALRKAGATSEEAAVPYTPANALEERMLRRLLASGEVRRGRRDGYWVDVERARALRHARMRLVAMVLLVEFGITLGLALNLPHHHR